MNRVGDSKVSPRKVELITRLREWGARGAVVVEDQVGIVVANLASKMRNESLQDAELLENELGMVGELKFVLRTVAYM